MTLSGVGRTNMGLAADGHKQSIIRFAATESRQDTAHRAHFEMVPAGPGQHQAQGLAGRLHPAFGIEIAARTEQRLEMGD